MAIIEASALYFLGQIPKINTGGPPRVAKPVKVEPFFSDFIGKDGGGKPMFNSYGNINEVPFIFNEGNGGNVDLLNSKDPKFKDLFVFGYNDNEFHFYHRNDGTDIFPNSSKLRIGARSCTGGGGNAGARKYQNDTDEDVKRAFGVPTGDKSSKNGGKGYPVLDAHVESVITDSMMGTDGTDGMMNILFARMPVVSFYSSVSKTDHSLGTGIFNPCDPVKVHIVAEMNATAAKYNKFLLEVAKLLGRSITTHDDLSRMVSYLKEIGYFQ